MKQFVYLMRNERSGFVKIGRSANPVYREKTLQAEEPEVMLLCAYSCALEMERELHEVFECKRLRGEWFALTPFDLWNAESALYANSEEGELGDPLIEEHLKCLYYEAIHGA